MRKPLIVLAETLVALPILMFATIIISVGVLCALPVWLLATLVAGWHNGRA